MTAYNPLTLRRAIELAAPHTWPASVLPVLLGTLLARGGLKPGIFFLTLAAAVLLQSAVNTLNDVRDFVRGTDTLENCGDDTDAAMVYGRLSPRAGLALGLSFLALAAACGVALALLTSWRIWYFGLAAAAAIALYTLGAAATPFGELLSGLSMGGVLPMAALYAQCGQADWTQARMLIPGVITIACIMLTNNTADVARDAETGRRTLAVRLGGAKAQRLLCALLLLSLFAVAVLVLSAFPGGWPALPVIGVGALLAARPLYSGAVSPVTRERCMGAIVRTHDWILGGYVAAIAVSLL